MIIFSLKNLFFINVFFEFINKHVQYFKLHSLEIFFFFNYFIRERSVAAEDYESYPTVYDGLLNTLFPIFFVILFRIDNSSTTKKKLLPIFAYITIKSNSLIILAKAMAVKSNCLTVLAKNLDFTIN